MTLYRRLFLTISLLLLLASSLHAETSVAPERLARLQHGIGIAHWFWGFFGAADITPYLRERVTDGDLALIRALGFDHIRIVLDTTLFYDWQQPGVLRLTYLDDLDQAVLRAQQHDLAVILALVDSEYNTRAIDPALQAELSAFWITFGPQLQRYDPALTFIQIANEPSIEPADWMPLQAALVAQARAVLPDHTFITASPLRYNNNWDMIGALGAMQPLADPNVVYGFHFYEPVTFSHYNAEWLDFGDAVLPNTWDRTVVENALQAVVDWAQTHNVPLIVDEFGVYHAQGVDPHERLAWLCTVSRTLSANNIHWTTWDYNGGFGLVALDASRRTFDLQEIQALGLLPGGCPVSTDPPTPTPEATSAPDS